MKDPAGAAKPEQFFGEANIRLLREKYPALAEQLSGNGGNTPDAPAIGDIRVETAASGDPTLIIGGLHIHSPRDPVREGRRAVEAVMRDSPSGISAGVSAGTSAGPSAGSPDGPIVLLGLGLGYAAESAAETWPERPLIIVERRRRILIKALETRNLETVFSHKKLILVLGEKPAKTAAGQADETWEAVKADVIIGALNLSENLAGGRGEPVLIRNPGLVNLDREWYAEVERLAGTWVSRDAVNQATLRRFGKRWVRNLARNMDAIRDLPGISRLAGILRPAGTGTAGIPALLAAAGPSLESITPFLPALAERCLIVAVDTSIRLLLTAGIEPDFVAAVDPQYWNTRHLDHIPALKTRLIAESAVYPSVLRHPFGGAFLSGSLFPLGRFIEDRVDPKGELGAGGSVATTAWDFTRTLTPESIWIAGLDLSYPALKTHFRGARFEEKALAESDRMSPAETRSVRTLRDGRPFRAPSAQGGQVLTDRRLALYAAWFENRFRYSPIPNYSLSPEGLAIAGLIPAAVEEALALPPRREEINRRLEEIFARIDADFNRPETRARRAERYESARKTLLMEMRDIETLAAEAAEIAEKTLRGPRPEAPEKRERVLNKLDEVNRRIAGSAVKDAAGFLFPPVSELEAELKTPESDSFARHLELSAKLYRALADAANYNRTCLEKQAEYKKRRCAWTSMRAPS